MAIFTSRTSRENAVSIHEYKEIAKLHVFSFFLNIQVLVLSDVRYRRKKRFLRLQNHVLQR